MVLGNDDEKIELVELEELEELPLIAKGADESILVHDFDPEEELKKSKEKKKKILAIVLPIVSVVVIASILCGILIPKSINKNNDSYVSKTYSIGTVSNTTAVLYAKGDGCEYEGLGTSNVYTYSDIDTTITMLLQGEVDCVIVDYYSANAVVQNDSTNLKMIPYALAKEEYVIGVDKNQTDLLDEINRIIDDNITPLFNNSSFSKAVFNHAADWEMCKGIMDSYGGYKTLDMSKSDQQLVVATNAVFPPFEYCGDDGKIYGIDLIVAAMIAQELGQELVIVDMEFASVITSVGDNGIDVCISAVTAIEARRLYVDFSNPYYNASQYIIVKADCTLFDNCKSAEDVENILRNF